MGDDDGRQDVDDHGCALRDRGHRGCAELRGDCGDVASEPGDTITLEPNEDRTLRRSFLLPIMAPTGDYQLRLRADDGTLIVTDSCSFDVV
jgi:hypothetical protein